MDVQVVTVQIVVQLWQIVLAVFVSGASLITIGYCAARAFVSRRDCEVKHAQAQRMWDDLYTITRQIQQDVSYLKGIVVK